MLRTSSHDEVVVFVIYKYARKVKTVDNNKGNMAVIEIHAKTRGHG